MRMLTDWEYEPIDDRTKGVLLYDDYLRTYHALDPVRPTYLPSIFSETTLREIRPRFEAFDPDRFLHLQRPGLRIRGAPHPNASLQFPVRQIFPLSKTCGQWVRCHCYCLCGARIYFGLGAHPADCAHFPMVCSMLADQHAHLFF